MIAKELKELLKNIDDEAEVVYSDGKLVYSLEPVVHAAIRTSTKKKIAMLGRAFPSSTN